MAKLESDNGLIELLRQSGPQSVSELAAAMHVTGTAVRQRLSRLMAGGLIGRDVSHGMRGRPSHRYSLTDKGLRQTGSNFTDLALALWREVREIKDLEVRRGLMQRIAQAMAGMYGPQVQGETLAERMESVSRVFAERDVPLKVETRDKLPVLTALACPYPALAEQDRGICAVERMLFSELLGESVRLAECRLDGPATCCRFQTN
jgi:predicted ArsR family transcriptional regulator